MPNTYTQLHIQFIFAVRYREALIEQEWQQRLHQYITGIFQKHPDKKGDSKDALFCHYNSRR